MVQSKEAETILLFERTQQSETGLLCPCSVNIYRHFFNPQIIKLVSLEPETMLSFPRTEQQLTSPLCPHKLPMHTIFFMSHNFKVLSLDAETTFPFFMVQILFTHFKCPLRVATHCFVSTLIVQIMMTLFLVILSPAKVTKFLSSESS